MQKFGKIICGSLHVPQNYPCSIELDGQTIHHPTEEQLRAAGYLPLELTDPEEKPGKIAIATYATNKQGTAIVQSWEYIDEPEERVEDGEPVPNEEAATNENK